MMTIMARESPRAADDGFSKKEEPLPAGGGQNPAGPKILLVDDRPQNLLALEAILGDMGHNLIRARSGREALRYLLYHDVALVLLDVRMPVMNGFETARLIRQREKSKTTPIIFLTAATGDQEMVSEGYSAGGVDYIVKPFIPEILRAKVEVFLNLAAARRSLEEEVTRRREAEKQLEASAEGLRLRAIELQSANQELAAFAYSASHDLRAPLRHIDGFCRLLTEGAGEMLDAEHRQYLDHIARSAGRMGRLLDHLIDLSKAGRAEMFTTAVDLNSLLDEVLEGLEPELTTRNIVWEKCSLPTVVGDEAMLRQVLVNLVSNSLKYTIRKDPANIAVGYRLNPDEAIIFIRDNGAGFDMKHAGKLFKVFQRLHTEREFKGSGIGLAIVQRIVQRHGGRVWGEGKPGEGATFYFSLPRRRR